MSQKKTIFLHTGSNVGDRLQNLRQANVAIEQHIGQIVQRSHIYETDAWGIKEQPSFFNQALQVATTLSPEGVLDKIYHIEREIFQRIRKEKWAERVMDIDILFYEDSKIDTPHLTIPHPQIQHRNFVIIPLMEIAGEWEHPVLGKTMEELYWESKDWCDVVMTDDF